MGTAADAHVATGTVLQVNDRLIPRVEEKLSSDGSTSHTEVLQCASETSLLMPLEVIEGDNYISIGYSRTDHRCPGIIEVNLYLTVISPLDSVANYHMAPCAEDIVAI